MESRSKLARRESGFCSYQGNASRTSLPANGPIVMNTQADLEQAARGDSRRELHRERLSRDSLLQLNRSLGLPCARDPDEKPKSLRESVNSYLWPFAHQVLNIRHAIPWNLDREIGRPDGAYRARPLHARERLLGCPYSRCRLQSYFVATTSHGVALRYLNPHR